VRGNVERIVRPSNNLTLRWTSFACEPFLLVESSVGDNRGLVDDACCSRSRSALRASACALRSALSASMRACIRASSSFSSCFFLRNASRADCAALEAVSDLESGGVAFCFPFAFAEGGRMGETGMGRWSSGAGVDALTAAADIFGDGVRDCTCAARS
jgi:hypothetical protein